MKHEQMRAQGYTLLRSKLPFGDYALLPTITVDTKQNIAELAQNVHYEHARFRSECLGAKENGIKLVILVENDEGIGSLRDLCGWKEPESQFRKRKNAKTPIDGEKLAKACSTMSDRYGVAFEFCEPSKAAGRIIEILEKESGNYGK